MPTDNSTSFHGSTWQNLLWRVTGWFRPTHPRFGLHLFLIALTAGLLMSMAWLAVHGIVQQFRHGPVAAGTTQTGPGSPLPTPMAGGKAALPAAGEGRASSWAIQEGGQPVVAPKPDATAEDDSVGPDVADTVNAPADMQPAPAEDGATPQPAMAASPVPTNPVTREAVRIGQQAEVTLSVQIDEEGNPVQVSVQRSSGSPAVDSAALLQMRSRHFAPVLRDGEPVPATLTVPVQVPAPDH